MNVSHPDLDFAACAITATLHNNASGATSLDLHPRHSVFWYRQVDDTVRFSQSALDDDEASVGHYGMSVHFHCPEDMDIILP